MLKAIISHLSSFEPCIYIIWLFIDLVLFVLTAVSPAPTSEEIAQNRPSFITILLFFLCFMVLPTLMLIYKDTQYRKLQAKTIQPANQTRFLWQCNICLHHFICTDQQMDEDLLDDDPIPSLSRTCTKCHSGTLYRLEDKAVTII